MDEEEKRKITKTFTVAIRKSVEATSRRNQHVMNLLDLCEEMATYVTHKPDCTVSDSCTCGLENVLKKYNLLNVMNPKE